MLRILLAFALFFGSIAAFILAVGDNSSPAPALTPERSAAAEAKLDEFSGAGNWQNARWHSPITDSEGRTYIYVEFTDKPSGQDVKATIVLVGNRASLILDTPAGARQWTELLDKD